MSNVFCLLVSFMVSSWTEGGAGGSDSESLVLLSNHFACFLIPPSDSCSVLQEALYHHRASPLAPSTAVRLCCRPLVEETEGRWSWCYCHRRVNSRTEHFSSRIFLAFGHFGGCLKAELHSVCFHASRGCCFLK